MRGVGFLNGKGVCDGLLGLIVVFVVGFVCGWVAKCFWW